MSARKEPPTPLFEEADGPILVGVGNQLIDAFDIEALPLEVAALPRRADARSPGDGRGRRSRR